MVDERNAVNENEKSKESFDEDWVQFKEGGSNEVGFMNLSFGLCQVEIIEPDRSKTETTHEES